MDRSTYHQKRQLVAGHTVPGIDPGKQCHTGQFLHHLSLAYFKLAKDKQRLQQRLRSFMELYFPEYLHAFDIESQTSLHLLEHYFLPHHCQWIG